MKKLIIFISLIFISSNVYCQNLKSISDELDELIGIPNYGEHQNLKGSLKYGGEYQNGEPFKVTYRSAMFGKLEGGSLVTDAPVNVEFTVFFNFNNENKIKVIFPNGKVNIIHNINNIEKTSYRQEAEGGTQDWSLRNRITVYLENDNAELTIIDNRTRDVVRLTMPK